MVDAGRNAPNDEPGNSPGVKSKASRTSARHGVELLLQIEADTRSAENVAVLTFLIANETLRISQTRQVFVFGNRGGNQRISAVSALGKVEKDSPRIRWMESVVLALFNEAGLAAVSEFVLPANSPPSDPEYEAFPYHFLVWVPFKLRDGHVFGGMIVAHDRPLEQSNIVVLTRLAETYGHAWSALTGANKLKRSFGWKPVLVGSIVLAAAAGFIPIPLSVLAPTEVVPIQTRIVAAPIDGVIESIDVDPNAYIRRGQPLLHMSDTTLHHALAVAEQEVNVAEAKLKQATQAAIVDVKMRSDLAIVGTELSLAVTKREYASDLLARTRVRSPQDGVAIFTDKRDLIGRPVSTGERLMEVANPLKVQIRIDVPVADAIAVNAGAFVRAFLDSDPLRPVHAKVRTTSFEAQMTDGNILAYRVYATLVDPNTDLRLGIRGTAQISGKRVPLAYYLFRRPIATIRQWFGL